jgi:hypothetical protein
MTMTETVSHVSQAADGAGDADVTNPIGAWDGDDTGARIGALVTERLEAEIKTLAGHLAAGTCRWLLLIAEYERRKGYAAWECVSVEQWLSVHAGVAPSTARAYTAVARSLGALPHVTAAFADGRLSWSKVRALCRVATTANEAEWVGIALTASAAQLERLSADVRRTQLLQSGGIGAVQRDARSLSWSWTDTAMLRVSAVLPPEIGAVLVRLLREHLDREERVDAAQPLHPNVPANDDTEHDGTDADVATANPRSLAPRVEAAPSLAQRTADAFAAIIRRSATHADNADQEPRPLVVVHRDLDGTTRMENGPQIPEEVADELACDADTINATHSEAGVHFDRRRRTPTHALRRYLLRRDRGCVFPGCGRQRGVAAHHIVEYAAGHGETTKENLILLCAMHHGAVHRRGWTVTGSAEHDTLTFTDPSGRSHPRAAPRPWTFRISSTTTPPQASTSRHLRPAPREWVSATTTIMRCGPSPTESRQPKRPAQPRRPRPPRRPHP